MIYNVELTFSELHTLFCKGLFTCLSQSLSSLRSRCWHKNLSTNSLLGSWVQATLVGEWRNESGEGGKPIKCASSYKLPFWHPEHKLAEELWKSMSNICLSCFKWRVRQLIIYTPISAHCCFEGLLLMVQECWWTGDNSRAPSACCVHKPLAKRWRYYELEVRLVCTEI